MRPPIAAPDGSIALEPTHLNFERGIELRYCPSFGSGLRSRLKQPLTNPTILLLLAILPIGVGAGFAALSQDDDIPFWSFFLILAYWLATLSALAVLAFNTVFFLVLHLFSSRVDEKRALILTPSFLIKRRGMKETLIPWNRVVWVQRWWNDILCSTFASSFCIPRSAFKSTEEAHEFFELLRILHKGGGRVWLEEWNGKTFGLNE